jgi:hypothetical protein
MVFLCSGLSTTRKKIHRGKIIQKIYANSRSKNSKLSVVGKADLQTFPGNKLIVLVRGSESNEE